MHTKTAVMRAASGDLRCQHSGYERRGLLLLLALLLQSCSLEPPEMINPVTWYAVNGWNAPVEFRIIDRVCNRRLGNIRLGVREEIAVTSCGNEANQAQIRYRRDSAYATPWSDGSAREGQRLQMQ
ncbi:MAG: hypothetical protein MRY76_07035 [Pseudomonadales bacterium]|nr:hypothetical protein [Pseudomonadales bacterium]